MLLSHKVLTLATSLVLLMLTISDGNPIVVGGQKTWCIAKPSSDEATLQGNIDYSCAQVNVDCGKIKNGGPCYEPNSRMNHAAVAMNLYYQSVGGNQTAGDCDFKGSGLVVVTNPSYGSCIYA
ncbi:hypothetical protein RIF29_38871 [Crotalaria pallida]|uniref:X8 domain-containing protein n=1 Tax=Crotalaria pallida TaxID=3830 RepID=A0AAN9HSS8_CROPI